MATKGNMSDIDDMDDIGNMDDIGDSQLVCKKCGDLLGPCYLLPQCNICG